MMTLPRRSAAAGIAVVCAIATVVAAPRPANAFGLFGHCLFRCAADDNPDGLIDPKPYEASIQAFAEDAPGRELEKIVGNASLLWQGRKKPAAGSAGLLTRAKADYKRILAALYDDGRYSADISITWNGREIADIPAGTEFPDHAELNISVRAQPRFRFGRAEIVNQAPPPATRADRVALPADEGFATGAPAYATTVRKAARLATDAWRQQGYPKAGIASQTVTANHDSAELNVELTVDPGQRAVYGPVAVEGTDRMKAEFVARQTGILEGREYDPDDLTRAEKRLQRMGVFRSTSLKEAQSIGPDGRLPLTLTVQERKLHRIGIGATVSSADGAGVEGYWLHRNLFGRGERLRFDGRVSGIGTTTDFQDFDYFLGTELTLPGRFTPDTDITIGGYFEHEVLDLYSRNRGSASVYASHFYSDEVTVTAGTYVSYGEYDDVFGTRHFGVAGLEAGVEYDTRDNKLNPKAGVYAKAGARPFYEWVRGNAVGKVEAEARVFHGFGANERTVLAARIKAGSIVGAPVTDIPQDELFLAGGGSSVRGYPYRGIGIAVPGGMSGGRALFEASAEIRQDITDSIGIVGFADLGHVNSGSLPDFSDDTRIGAGLGLRYNTGFGPLRLDFAMPLNKQAGDPDFAFYAGIGQAF